MTDDEPIDGMIPKVLRVGIKSKPAKRSHTHVKDPAVHVRIH